MTIISLSKLNKLGNLLLNIRVMLKYITVNKVKRRKMSSDKTETEKCESLHTVGTLDRNLPPDCGEKQVCMTSCSRVQFEYQERRGDLFSCDPSVSLTHCVSVDLHMGKGIAVIFKKKFKGVHELQAQGKKIGEVAVLKREARYVYYLITKEKYWGKPTYATLQASLEAMRCHAVENGVPHIAMPKIGCGLDGLKWDKVSPMIKSVFHGINIRITVYYL